MKYTDPDGRSLLGNLCYVGAFFVLAAGTTVSVMSGSTLAVFIEPAALEASLALTATGLAINASELKINNVENRAISIPQVKAVSKTKTTQPNQIVIQIQDNTPGIKEDTLASSGPIYGDPKVGVTKAQTLGALELATANLASTNKSMAKSPDFQRAKAELQSKIISSPPRYEGCDLDSRVPAGNAPNFME